MCARAFARILAYRYRGHPYRAIVHGQRAEVVFGRSPIDWSKVGWRVAVLAAIATAAVALWLDLPVDEVPPFAPFLAASASA